MDARTIRLDRRISPRPGAALLCAGLSAGLSAGVGAGLSGCANDTSSFAVADEILAAPGATGEGFGDSSLAVNGVRGGGLDRGSLDVYSLDYRGRSSITLGFSGRAFIDGPGADLVVFENGFRESTRDAYFMDPLVVEVSPDGVRWLAFPHDYVAADESRYEPRPEAWQGFAGIMPVLWNVDTSAVDPFDPLRAGGDAFDLSELVLDGQSEEDAALGREIGAEGARFVRLTSAAILVNPDTGLPFPRDAVSDGADIDGIVARYLVPIGQVR